jgi:hypothetical protein
MARANQKARQPVATTPDKAAAEAMRLAGGDREKARQILYESAINQFGRACNNLRRSLAGITADLDALPVEIIGGLNRALADLDAAAKPNGAARAKQPVVAVKAKA